MVSEVFEVVGGVDAAVDSLVDMGLVGDDMVDGMYVDSFAASMVPRASTGEVAVDYG